MKRKIEGGYVWVGSIILLLIICTQLRGQVFFNKSLYPEIDVVLIPSIHFGYGLKQYDFIEHNTGLEVARKQIQPELYLGCQLLSNGFMAGIHYGVLQNSIMLGGGFTIPIHKKIKQLKK